jgi:hypothetical protein
LGLLIGLLIGSGGVAEAVNWDNGDPNDSLWSTPGNWQENSMNGPGGSVPVNENVFFDFGPCYVTTAVPAVRDVFVANAVPPPDPEDPNAATNHTELFIQSGGVLTMSGGQLKVGAFTSVNSPPTGVQATVHVTGTGVVDSQYGVVTNPLYHPTFGNISSTINLSGDGLLDAGTGLFLGGGDTTINMSDNAMFLAPDGIFEHVEGGNSTVYDPMNINNPFGINAVINLSGNAKFVVPNTGTFAVDATLADLYISAGLFSGTGIMHAVEGDNRVFMAAAGLTGDHNGDGTVDAADYVVWRKTDGDPAGYNAWRSNFGATAGGGAGLQRTAVPEPASCWLAWVAATLLFIVHRS